MVTREIVVGEEKVVPLEAPVVALGEEPKSGEVPMVVMSTVAGAEAPQLEDWVVPHPGMLQA
jgi:hypothetical protein